MIENGFEENLKIKYSEIDQNLALKPFTLLNFLQDIASKNAEDLGFGYSKMYPQNLAWFLIKYRMEFSDYPFDIADLKLVTMPRGYNKLFAYRDFEFWRENKCLGRVSSVWTIVDLTSHSMIQPAMVIKDNPRMVPFVKKEDDLIFSKIKTFETPQKEMKFEVRYNDIDVNGHANNGNYIIWALETLDFQYKNCHKIKTLDIIYKKEARHGEKIRSLLCTNNNITTHIIKNSSNEDLCLIECTWDKI